MGTMGFAFSISFSLDTFYVGITSLGIVLSTTFLTFHAISTDTGIHPIFFLLILFGLYSWFSIPLPLLYSLWKSYPNGKQNTLEEILRKQYPMHPWSDANKFVNKMTIEKMMEEPLLLDTFIDFLASQFKVEYGLFLKHVRSI
jgi:hypothetical protein